ncbi:THUMP-like domain-containing protein [Hugenholtzia roseola]|uniref:THUMP-like domain-containing protein n=1 Tax=Hugenholtzia roseola TaxID=1002 RepID=UPI00054EC336|nr:hypothetical protein [Hugenholtzia roseola]
MNQALLHPDVQAFIRQQEGADLYRLALQKVAFEGVRTEEILNQIQFLKKIKSKVPYFYAQYHKGKALVFPPLLSYEQASSQTSAEWKAEILAQQLPTNGTFADLTGGFGVDCFFIGSKAGEVFYVEQNPLLAQIVAHNFALLGLEARFFPLEAETFLKQCLSENKILDAVLIDPARRDSAQKKVFLLADTRPDVVALLPLLAQSAKQILLKTSPMLDIKAALAELERKGFWVEKVWVVSVENECKELLFLLQNERYFNPPITTQNLPSIEAVDFVKNGDSALIKKTFCFSFWEEENASASYSLPQKYLYEPSSALLKAGAFKVSALRLGLSKLHAHSHLYTGARFEPTFQGRIFEIQHLSKLDKKEISLLIPEKKANILVRNFPLTPAEIAKKLGFQQGGKAFLIATTQKENKPILIVATKINQF